MQKQTQSHQKATVKKKQHFPPTHSLPCRIVHKGLKTTPEPKLAYFSTQSTESVIWCARSCPVNLSERCEIYLRSHEGDGHVCFFYCNTADSNAGNVHCVVCVRPGSFTLDASRPKGERFQARLENKTGVVTHHLVAVFICHHGASWWSTR